MSAPLRILHLEDDPGDAALIQATLEAGDLACDITLVQGRSDFVAALERGGLDLILSDFGLPTFDGLSALAVARARCPELPIILVSGTMGEEQAVDSLKNGATDYVLKERLTRLAPAVHRAMRETAARAEHRRIEAQFIEAQKMDVIGQLAGGVAHDFNNILAVIMGYSDLILDRLSPDSPVRAFAEGIRQASERGVGLTRQLLLVSRKESVKLVALDLNVVVKDMEKMLLRLIGENVEMTIVPGEPLGHITADPGYVGQVLMNLAVNARDAMPNGGKLGIATRNVTLDATGASACPGALPGDYVMLSVRDTGVGMTDEVKTHLFQAFFTTKPKGKGTGLGLATCHSIVKKSSGHIVVDSALGKGTAFHLYFPQTEPPRGAAARPAPSEETPRGAETLLFVEDEPSVRYVARLVLEAQGYEVLLASNGQEALHVAQEHRGAPIRLVITDVVMPIMGGEVMAEWLRSTYPELKVLFTSGYTDDAITPPAGMDAGVQFLAKPYTPTTLARTVREMLDR